MSHARLTPAQGARFAGKCIKDLRSLGSDGWFYPQVGAGLQGGGPQGGVPQGSSGWNQAAAVGPPAAGRRATASHSPAALLHRAPMCGAQHAAESASLREIIHDGFLHPQDSK